MVDLFLKVLAAVGIIILFCIGVVVVEGTISVLRVERGRRHFKKKIVEMLGAISREDLKKIIEQGIKDGKNN